MKASKRLLGSLMAGVLCISALAGCGGSGSTGDSSTGSSSGGSAAAGSGSSGDTMKICLVIKQPNEFFNTLISGAEGYCEDNPNVTVETKSPNSATDFDGQINMIETSLGSGEYDAMIIDPLQSESTAGLVKDATIPIIACDTDFTSDSKIAFVGTGNEAAAKEGGKACAEMAIENGSEKPTAVILTGVQGDETHEARLAGYKAGIEEAGGEVLEVQYCDAMADKAANAMEAVMQKYPDGVDIVCSTTDDMILAAMKVKNDTANAAYDNCVMCGFDGNTAAVEAVQDGTLAMTIAQQSYQMGYKAMEAAVAAVNGEDVDENIDSGVTLVTADTVDEYLKDTAK